MASERRSTIRARKCGAQPPTHSPNSARRSRSGSAVPLGSVGLAAVAWTGRQDAVTDPHPLPAVPTTGTWIDEIEQHVARQVEVFHSEPVVGQPTRQERRAECEAVALSVDVAYVRPAGMAHVFG